MFMSKKVKMMIEFDLQRFANIYNSNSNSLVIGTRSNDFIENNGSKVTLSGGKGNDTIGNYGGSHSSINAGAGNDSIGNWGENNTIAPGSGNDYINNDWAHGTVYIYGGGNDTINRFRSQNNFIVIENYTWSTLRVQDDDGNNTNDVFVNVLDGKKTIGSILLEDTFWEDKFNIVSSKADVKLYNLIISGNGKDKAVLTGTSGKDYVETDGWQNVTIKTGAGNDIINNGEGYGDYEGRLPDDAFIDAGAGNDWIENKGNGSTINAGAGNDTIYNRQSNFVIINAGKGNDYIENDGGSSVSINAGNGNNTITNSGENLTVLGGKGNNYINSWGDGMAYVYSGGNDTIQNFQLSSKIVLGKAAVKSSVRNYENGDVTLNISDGGSIVLKEHWDGVINTVASASEVKPLNIIHSNKNNKKVTGTSGDDVIISTNQTDNDPSGGYSKVTINAGAGGDFIKVSGTKNLVNLESGNDVAENWGSHTTMNGGAGNDYIESYREGGEYSSLVGGTGDDSIVNHAPYSTLIGGDGKDSIVNNNSHVSVTGGNANVYVYSAGNDFIKDNFSPKSLFDGGIGNDTIKVLGTLITVTGGKDNDQILLNSTSNLIKYKAGDGNDTIFGFNSTDTLSITGGSYSTQESGDDVLVKVGTGKILLKNVKGNAININKKNVGGADNFIYNSGDDVIFGFDNKDTLTFDNMDFTSSCKDKVVTLNFDEGSITLKDFTTSTFHINNDIYKISGSKFIKQK